METNEYTLIQNLTPDQKYWIVLAMTTYGGSFVKYIGEALRRADQYNTRRLQEAFPDYMETYWDIGLKMKKAENAE